MFYGTMATRTDLHPVIVSTPAAGYFTSKTDLITATVSYGSKKLTAIIEQYNLLACQFHPEKSGKTGEKLLRRWLKNIK